MKILRPLPPDLLRRRLLGLAGGVTAAGLVPGLSAWTARNAAAQAFTDYKALVCVFLYGGNDTNNTVVPIDNYASYAAVRGNSSVGLGVGELAPIRPASGGAYGLHPRLAPLAPVFAAGRMAVVCNVGTLAAPLTRTQYRAGTGKAPRNLFSHSDQQLQWQGLVPNALANTGWGGRVADATLAGNSLLGIPGVLSVSGDALFTIGRTSIPLALPGDGGNGLSGDFDSDAGQIRYAALQKLLTVDRDATLVQKAGEVMALALKSAKAINDAVGTVPAAVQSAFQGVYSGLADQLARVATLIAAKDVLGVNRHIFFCSMGGYDTHSNQRNDQGDRLGELGPALAAFEKAIEGLNVAPQVTAFTMSDFSRTFRVNANEGTDHAWGSHQFVLGGAVKGGTFYGAFPTLLLDGPDDAGSEGQWIPTTSLDQFGATLARWFGVPGAGLADIFPNVGAFTSADLGFLA
jgi:uncharacterized protein (DUF1501 family)